MNDVDVTIEDVTVDVAITEEALSFTLLDTTIDTTIVEETITIPDPVEVVVVNGAVQTVDVQNAEETIEVIFGEVVFLQSEEFMTYAKRTDFIGDNLIYRAEAQPGTLNNQAAWRIRRITIDTGNEDDITEEWAGGQASFSHVWDDRLSLSYS